MSKGKTKAAPKSTAAVSSISIPAIAKGEVLAGIILEKGTPKHWLVLLPGEAENVTWAEAKAFAKKAGGELPTRKEQSLLFANAGEHFQQRWYWSGGQPAGVPGCAWNQNFSNGPQNWNHVSNHNRARAVRRVPIK